MSSRKSLDPFEIYSARISITPDSDLATVHIRHKKRGKTIKEKISLPEEIIELEREELIWSNYDGKNIIVYHRKYDDKRGYLYLHKNVEAPKRLSQKLEKIVYETLKKI